MTALRLGVGGSLCTGHGDPLKLCQVLSYGETEHKRHIIKCCVQALLHASMFACMYARSRVERLASSSPCAPARPNWSKLLGEVALAVAFPVFGRQPHPLLCRGGGGGGCWQKKHAQDTLKLDYAGLLARSSITGPTICLRTPPKNKFKKRGNMSSLVNVT